MPALITTVARALGLAMAAFVVPLAAQQAPAGRVLGTVQALSGRTLTVVSDAGAVTTVAVEESTRLLQIEPGQTDLREAKPFALSDLQAGDRVLVRGVPSEDGKTLRAASLVAMKKSAITEKQSRERAEWQHGVGGLVKSVDPGARTLQVAAGALSANREIALHLADGAVLRRYSPDSTRFEAAKPAPLSEVHPGDQLRARGTRGADGASFEAIEVVTGTFRNLAGTVAGGDAAGGTLVVEDLGSKSAVGLRITPESQMRKLPAEVAERLAARLKGAGSAPEAPARGNGDLQQLIARLPALPASELHKGEAVLVVAMPAGPDAATVVTLLAGVEAILRASPKGGSEMILSPWSLGGGEPSPN